MDRPRGIPSPPRRMDVKVDDSDPPNTVSRLRMCSSNHNIISKQWAAPGTIALGVVARRTDHCKRAPWLASMIESWSSTSCNLRAAARFAALAEPELTNVSVSSSSGRRREPANARHHLVEVISCVHAEHLLIGDVDPRLAHLKPLLSKLRRHIFPASPMGAAASRRLLRMHWAGSCWTTGR